MSEKHKVAEVSFACGQASGNNNFVLAPGSGGHFGRYISNLVRDHEVAPPYGNFL